MRYVEILKSRADLVRDFVHITLNYASEIAPVGQAPSQAPQSMQVASSISNLPSPMLIAPTGHVPSQAPQATQASEILRAML